MLFILTPFGCYVLVLVNLVGQFGAVCGGCFFFRGSGVRAQQQYLGLEPFGT